MIILVGLVSVLWLGRVAAAEDAKPESPSGKATELAEPPLIDSPGGPGPRGPGFGGQGFGGQGFGGQGFGGQGFKGVGPGPFGPGRGPGRGPMGGPGGNGPSPEGPQPNAPGMGPGGMGPGGEGGPRRYGHPGGSPRWPHDSWETLQKNDPEMYELLVKDNEMDGRAMQLAVQYRRAPIVGRAAIKKELEQLLGQHFEIRQQRRVLELKRLEEELERLRNAIELRNKAREELVRKRMTQLLGEQEGLDF